MDPFILFNDPSGIEMNCFITLNGRLYLTILDSLVQLNSGSITLNKNDAEALITFLQNVKTHIVDGPSGLPVEVHHEEKKFIENYLNESEGTKLQNIMDYSFLKLFFRNN